MKAILFVLLVSAGIANTTATKAQQANVSFSVFYNSLQPYGRWMNNPTYGQVWISNVRGFSPYSTGGHWAYTNYGWTWVSDYSWGWAPFHYGRWAYDPAYGGWFWVPGYEWAPAWVAWRNSNDYYGWAPLSPGLNISIGISAYNAIPATTWVFAPVRYISSPSINRYYVPRSRNVTIINQTTVVNNVTVKNNVQYVAGPRREDVERVSHKKVKTYTVASSSKPGKTVVNKHTVNVYRPEVNSNNKTVNNNTTVNNKSNSKAATVKKQPSATTVVQPKAAPQQKLSDQQRAAAEQSAKQKAAEQARQKAQQQQIEKQKQQAQQKARDQQLEQQQKQQQAAQQKAREQAELKARQQKQQQEVTKKKTPDNRNNNKR